MIYIGGEVIVTPLGETTAGNWSALLANKTGIRRVSGAGFGHEDMFLAKFPDSGGDNTFGSLVMNAIGQVLEEIDQSIIGSPKTLVIVSSTKGALAQSPSDQFGAIVATLQQKFSLVNTPIVVSNACISGVLSINSAAGFISAGIYEHVIVTGCDMISGFIINGFQSLFAVSDQPCAPFDADRKGISLGEGCGAVLLSASADVFKNKPFQFLRGFSANDANHISGPSRTGEGLFRSVKKTMDSHGAVPEDIDYLCAHGTATVFNDEMESIAFDRAGLSEIPMNSLKGYFGHTLGAAGVIETAVCMSMLRNQILLKSAGFHKAGTSKPLNIISENKPGTLKTILKTASGFGGGNASLMIRAL